MSSTRYECHKLIFIIFYLFMFFTLVYFKSKLKTQPLNFITRTIIDRKLYWFHGVENITEFKSTFGMGNRLKH